MGEERIFHLKLGLREEDEWNLYEKKSKKYPNWGFLGDLPAQIVEVTFWAIRVFI